jgi:hypothetical protein
MTTGVPREITYQPGDAVYVGDDPADMPQRQRVLSVLAKVPVFVNVLSKLAAGDVFRVVMSKENAHLFKQGVDGVYKPFLHNGKHFVENVDLIRISPDYVRAVSDVALTVSMAAFEAKLEAIEVGVRNIEHLMADTQRGRVKGALDALALTRALADPAERRAQMISAGRGIVVELGALAGQLRAHIAAMPKETTGVLDGFFGSGFANAIAAYEQVKDDVVLLIDGARALLRTYQDLEEPAVAREAVDRILDGIKQAGLPDAIRKARLLPFPAAVPAPELFLGSFLDAAIVMETNLLRIDHSKRPLLAMDIKPEELLS